jgi:acylphosphatase
LSPRRFLAKRLPGGQEVGQGVHDGGLPGRESFDIILAVVARHFLVAGRVQGVGFRFFAEDAANREGLHGFARNLPDGRVEVEVEGSPDAVERFERAIRRGPPGARVETVEVTSVLPTGRVTGFSIRA